MRKIQILEILMDRFSNEPFYFREALSVVRQELNDKKVREQAIYQHFLKFVSSGICIRVARGYYALTQTGMAICLQSERDKAANAFLEELLKQKAEQDLIQFEIKALQNKIKLLQAQSCEKSTIIDNLTSKLLHIVE